MPRAGAPRSSSQDSSSSISDGSQHDDTAKLFAEAEKRIKLEYKRLAGEAVSAAKKDVEDIVERYTHAINVTHKAELNTLYTTLLSSLAEQDALLVPLYAELLKLDKDSHGALETLMHGLDGEVERAGKVGKGCWVTLRNEILEEQKGLEVINLGFGKRPRKSDETLVDSGGQGVE
ncbi:hypothetical protein EHS25_008707 [Saitozyma podzolica]|uniref:Uncharacterized protein n=1 Tax=Saitozyma podzolica TaxID=1890683 RepID=A0A427YME7_9TREE|nr:hypothetical protein EHS25_008707 [Saitozyma podzolica]